MSLIHQALRDMDPPLAADAAALAPRAASVPSRSRRVPVLALVAALSVAAAGVAGWYALNAGHPLAFRAASVAPPPAIIPTAAAASLQSALTAPPQPAPAAPVAPVEAPAAAVAPAAVDGTVGVAAAATAGPSVAAVAVAADAVRPAPVSAPAPAVVALPPSRERTAVPAPVLVADAATVPNPLPVRPAAEPPRSARPAHAHVPVQASPVQASPVRATAAARPAAVPPAAAAMPVEQRFNAFLQAMRTGDMPGAGQHLAALRRDLPPGSVSLLRAEGWYALAGGDADAAARIYQDLLDRLPGDEEASINLASIESRRQRGEAARRILADAVRVHPESESLKSALARFQAKP